MIPTNSFTLKAAVNEIKNISPEVSGAFIFKKDGEIIAQDDSTRQETILSAIKVFNEMTKHMDTVGGLEGLTVKGSNSQVCFTPCIDDFYLVTVSSKMADEKIIFAVNRVLVPTLVKLLNQLGENSEAQLLLEKPQPKEPKPSKKETEKKTSKHKTQTETVEQPAVIMDPEPYVPEPPVHQLMVEKMGGFLAPSDIVRIDSEVLASWRELYEGKTIYGVSIETLKLKTTKCKFKSIKETKKPTKGIIQVPEKIMLTLEASKGELVMVKPIIT